VNHPSDVTLEDLAGAHATAVLGRLRAQHPITWVPVLGGWFVTSHGYATAVMRDTANFTVDHPAFSTARVVGASMLSLDGVDHVRHRRPFAHPFRASQVTQRFGAPTDRLATDLVRNISATGHADLRVTLAGPLAVSVVTDILGLRITDAQTVSDWYAAIVGAVTDITAGMPPRPEAAQAMRELATAIDSPGTRHEDSLLAAAAGALDSGEVTSNAAVLMFGGIDTTEGMIANALHHVLRDPDLHAALAGDRGLLPAAVEESLRLEPAAAFVDRYATRDTTMGDVMIGEGDLVRVSLAAANRDPDVFPNPDRFDLSRTNLGLQLAFARGPHTCIAMDLARLETRAALAAVLDGLPGARLASEVDATGLVFRKPATLHVTWDTRGEEDGPVAPGG
jgi:cytochrome P450